MCYGQCRNYENSLIISVIVHSNEKYELAFNSYHIKHTRCYAYLKQIRSPVFDTAYVSKAEYRARSHSFSPNMQIAGICYVVTNTQRSQLQAVSQTTRLICRLGNTTTTKLLVGIRAHIMMVRSLGRDISKCLGNLTIT